MLSHLGVFPCHISNTFNKLLPRERGANLQFELEKEGYWRGGLNRAFAVFQLSYCLQINFFTVYTIFVTLLCFYLLYDKVGHQ